MTAPQVECFNCPTGVLGTGQFIRALGRRAISAVLLSASLLGTSVYAQTERIDMAIFHPERNFWTPTLKWWMEEVDKATQGRVHFVANYAGALVSANETLKAVRDGAVPAGVTSAAFITGTLPSLAYLEAIGGVPGGVAPFIESMEALRPVLQEEFHKQNVEYLWPQASGQLVVVCRDRLIKNVADWKGRKVRTAGRWQGEQLLVLGSSPVSIDPSEQYLALQNRTIDCALSVSVLAATLKLHEVAPKISVLRMPVNATFYVINRDIWNKLSADDRAAVMRISGEATKRSAAYLNEIQAEAENQMRTQKAEVYQLSDAEVADLRAAIAPAFAKMDAQGGEAGKRISTIVRRFW